MLVLLVASLIVFGPDRLPEIAAQVGRGLHKIRTTVNNLGAEVRTSVQAEVGDLDVKSLDPRVFVQELMKDDPPAPVSEIVPAVHEVNEGPDAMTLLHSPADYSELAFPEEWLVEQPVTEVSATA